ncbi:hypothetical protein [Paraclostridium sordellii]|uniref:hypothetical protein n=1 Tax=Paraclostridium sordellii TaxID=1505 RepID=UPI00038645A0|nr:hypothetical protein [Paeniclostridium sordellii]EPZ54399.1 hypothetical protein H476_3208 [[Clostridium] sordellii VPI 9048] [Paeniclostridium sordellii VPI 9048]CEK36713.1 hypothetical protein JGS6382_00471 [[Clostridium] sordellii] [Paeniclostridium sordellii]
MKAKYKLKDDKGSAMILAIIVIVLASIIILMLSKQIVSQIKTSKNTQNSIQADYNVQGNIEQAIGNFIERVSISDNGKENQLSSDSKLKYEASQSIVYRITRDVKANLLEALLINKQVKMPDKDGNNINPEGNLISDTGLYPQIGIKLKSIYFDKAYILKGNKKSPIDYVINSGEYIDKFNNENKKNALEVLNFIENTLNEILEMDELKDVNLTKDKKNIKSSISKSKDYIQYLINQINSNFAYFNYNNTLNQVYIEEVSIDDVNQLQSELKISIDYLQKIKNSVSNLEKLKMDSEKDKVSMQFIDDMIYIMKDTESDNYIEKLRFDIDELKNCNTYDQKVNQIIKISNRLDNLYRLIGKYNYEKEIMKIHKDGLPNENAGKEYEINSSNVDKESSIRVYAQFIRRYIKSSQVQLKYIKYKINKAFINEYILNDQIQDNVNEVFNSAEEIKTYEKTTEKINSLCNKILNKRNGLEEELKIVKSFGAKSDSYWWEKLWEYFFGHEKSQNDIYIKYDVNIGNIVKNLDSINESLENLDINLKELKSINKSSYEKLQIDNMIKKINDSINTIVKTRCLFNSIWSEGDHYNNLSKKNNNLKLRFPSNSTILQSEPKGSTRINLDKLFVNGVDYSLRVKKEEIYNTIETQSDNNIDIDIIIKSKEENLKSPIKAKVRISITNLKNSLDYDITYKILNWRDDSLDI